MNAVQDVCAPTEIRCQGGPPEGYLRCRSSESCMPVNACSDCCFEDCFDPG